MQDRYVADVGDFGKYGLLRCLTGMTCGNEKPLKLGVIWYLTLSCQGNPNDGRHLSYLDDPQTQMFKNCDASLFCEMKKMREKVTTNRNGRRVRLKDFMRMKKNSGVEKPALEHIQNSNILGEAIFFDKPIRTDTIQNREAMGKCDLLFLDPDNGLRVKYDRNGVFFVSKNDEKPSIKHVYIEEVQEALSDRQASVVLYHHLGRHGGKHQQQIKKIAKKLEEEFQSGVTVFCIRYRRGSGRAFFVLARDKHKELLKRRLTQFVGPDSQWVKREHLELAYPETT